MPDSIDSMPRQRRSTNLTASGLAGQFLVALPGMGDSRFNRAVIYMVMHGPDGAMGIILNKPSIATDFHDLLQQLNIRPTEKTPLVTVMNGGPCEAGHGYILHSDDFRGDGTAPVDTGIYLTRTLDIIQAIAAGEGPMNYFVALGYAGWQPGQLEEELQGSGWLTIPGDAALIFHSSPEEKWDLALARLGATPALLSNQTGHA